MNIDFQQALDDFTTSVGVQQDAIQSIYNILPSYTPKQQRLLFVIQYYIDKWDLEDLRSLIKVMDKRHLKNKSLSMLQNQSLKSLLSAYTQNEMIRGVKVQAVAGKKEE